MTTTKRIFLGLLTNNYGVKLLDVKNFKVVNTRDVVFHGIASSALTLQSIQWLLKLFEESQAPWMFPNATLLLELPVLSSPS